MKGAIGIDLGGTHIVFSVINPIGKQITTMTLPTQAHKGGKHVLRNILTGIEQLIRKTPIPKKQIIGIGLGTPGAVDRQGTLIGGAQNLPGWEGTNIYRPVQNKFNLRIVASNDATIAALGEARFGAGKGKTNVVMITLGTGIGGGIVINNKVYRGTHDMAGEVGHMTIIMHGRRCSCGKKGCFETYASATGIVRTAQDFIAAYPKYNSSLLLNKLKSGESLSSRLIYFCAAEGDSLSLRITEQTAEYLGIGIGNLLNILSPDIFIIGGGVTNAGDFLLKPARRYIKANTWNMIFNRTKVVFAKLGDQAGVVGAATLAFDTFN